MKRITLIVFVVFMAVIPSAEACTSAIISGALTADGRPILWKNRDTSTLENFVAKVDATSVADHSYIALYNAGDSLLTEAWIGVNDAAFAIMNTASYNLAPDTARVRDREGIVMAEALRTCSSMADFEQMLSGMSRPLGVQANFGVVDSSGDGAYYETCDTGYIKFPLSEAPGGYMVRTNYSISGAPDGGYGYIREANAIHLLQPGVKSRNLTAEDFTDGLSRSFYHSILGKDPTRGSDWIVDQDFIPRHSSSASVAIVLPSPGQPLDEAVMWCAVGYPPCAVTVPATLTDIPQPLRPTLDGWTSQAAKDAMVRKAEVFPIKRGSGSHYIDVKALKRHNEECRKKSLENYSRHRATLKR